MPNYVINRLIIKGNDEQIKKVRDFLKGDPYEDGSECLVDFHKIVPIPEIIMQVGNLPFRIERAVKNKEDIALFKLDSEEILKFNLACKAYEETGFHFWYDWRIANWGTKWNAINCRYDTPKNILVWETAWGCVLKLMEKLSSHFLDIEFEYAWADEDIGYNCGEAKIKNGRSYVYSPEEGSKEAHEFAVELRRERE